ncbi:hypothetical protein E1B28_012430 [Marasmius oreades]|uniref:Zinc knuckle-domain-containing protein n=1 Tax=Marasmius oreades TaxID=181124 RepID=A0A9P7RSU2_9AGAR|nr:uncharacterized protein E1B28_012430 [Marasmius oreades]KAG7088438.1 hypothetical protein E1B28_012430 [Marasmius oreades]
MSKFAPHRHSSTNPRATSSTICQKCLGHGHYTYECKSTRPYISRPSRTQQLENVKNLEKLKAGSEPSVEVPGEFKNKAGVANRILETREKERGQVITEAKGKSKEVRKRHRSVDESDSSSDSESDSGSDSESSDSSSSGSDSASSERSRKRRRTRKRRSNSRSRSSDDSE